MKTTTAGKRLPDFSWKTAQSQNFSDSGSSKVGTGGSCAAVGGKTKKQIKRHSRLE